MEKTPMYAVVSPPHACKRQWVAWVATGVSIVALVVACVTASVTVQQVDRVSELEGRMLEMQSHMEEILRFTINSHDYKEYDEYPGDAQADPYEELTVQRVLRRKRDAAIDGSTQGAAVPIYDQAYGVDLKGRSNSEGLRLYGSLMATKGEGDPTSPEVTFESTDSPIKPYHRISNLWVPKKRHQRYPTASSPQISLRSTIQDDDDDDDDEDDDDEDEDYRDNTISRQAIPISPVIERSSRTKSLHGSGRRVKLRQKTPVKSNPNPAPVLFRESLVKVTTRHDGFPAHNSVVPQPTRVHQPARLHQPTRLKQAPRKREHIRVQPPQTVEQRPETKTIISGPLRRRKSRINKNKKMKNGRKSINSLGRRRRRARSTITLAHFVATPANRTSHHGSWGSGQVHEEWMPAAWMDKLGLNRKYPLSGGAVTVKEAGLYYLYAQMFYESGRFGTGFQVLVDGIPIMECSLATTQPSHSCYTAGATYLPRDANVYLRDLEHYTTPVQKPENCFFGFLKLMDAPDTAEQLVLG